MHTLLIPISEYIRDHLTQQKARSVGSEDTSGINSNTCAYRGDGGLMCAVGALIDDDHYVSEFEGEGAYDHRVFNAVLESKQCCDLPDEVFLDLQNLLGRWQEYHDDVFCDSGFSPHASYQLWLGGDESHSPSVMHAALLGIREL